MGRAGKVISGERWGAPIEIERRRRILVAVWAYAYEFLHESIVDDCTFDMECMLIDLSINTDNAKMDAWFRANFEHDTGMWVQKHPDKKRLHEIATKLLTAKRGNNVIPT